MVGAVHIGGIKQADAKIQRLMDQRNRGAFVHPLAVERAHAHAAKTQSGDGRTIMAECAGLHGGDSCADRIV